MSAIIVIGDDVAIPVTLRKNGATFVIDPGATVRAALVDGQHQNLLTDPVTVVSTTLGSDWINSLIVVVMASAITGELIPMDDVEMEIEVNDSGRLTWFVKGLTLKKGLIS